MTLPNDSVLVTPGSGATIATESIGGKEYQVFIPADNSGHLQNSLETYMYMTPAAAVGANKLFCDIFNATGSGKVMDIRGIWICPDLDVAVVGALGIKIDLYRTSAVGTGGTAAAYKSATIDVAGGNINPFDTNNANLPAQVTARHLPTGGATIAQWVFPSTVFGEESATGVASYMSQWFNILPVLAFGQKFVVRENQGILLKQGAVAATGNIAIMVVFTLE